jgi:hypothetical protein
VLQYGSKVFQEGDRRNQLLHLLKGNTPAPDWPHVNDQPADVQIHQVWIQEQRGPLSV